MATAAALGLVPGGKLAVVVGNIGSSAWRGAVHYAGRFTGALARGAQGLASRARQWVRRKPPSACNCFAAGTLVWTATGLVPIEQVEVGDLVLTLDEATGETSYQQVLATIPTKNTALLELTLVHGSGARETIQTADEHPFWHALHGWSRADTLTPGDEIRTVQGTASVAAVAFTADRTTVYDLWVEENNNYLVGEDGVWVHNCGFDQLFRIKYGHFMHRKGWDKILGRARPTRREVGEVLETLVANNNAQIAQHHANGVTSFTVHGSHNGHSIYAKISARVDGLYEIVSAGLR